MKLLAFSSLLLPFLIFSKISHKKAKHKQSLSLKDDAIDIKNHHTIQLNTSVYKNELIENSKLKVINCGAGFTGTHTVSEILAELGVLPSLHFRRHYLDKKLNFVFNENSSSLHFEIRYCALSRKNEEKCLIHHSLRNISNYLETIALNFAAVGDTPVPLLASELISRVPNVKVLVSLRHKNDWMHRRLSHNSNDIICRKQFWNNSFVRHPFDITRCLLLMSEDDYVANALTTINIIASQFGNQSIVDAYSRTNKAFKDMVEPNNFFSFSLFEFSSKKESYEIIKQNITDFLKI